MILRWVCSVSMVRPASFLTRASCMRQQRCSREQQLLSDANQDWLLACVQYRLGSISLEFGDALDAQRLCDDALKLLGPQGNRGSGLRIEASWGASAPARRDRDCRSTLRGRATRSAPTRRLARTRLCAHGALSSSPPAAAPDGCPELWCARRSKWQTGMGNRWCSRELLKVQPRCWPALGPRAACKLWRPHSVSAAASEPRRGHSSAHAWIARWRLRTDA